MKTFVNFACFLLLSGAIACPSTAWSRGPGGGGGGGASRGGGAAGGGQGCMSGGGTATSIASNSFTPSIGTSNVYTGPGSAYQQAMYEQQARSAYLQQQAMIAAAKAAKEQAHRDQVKQTAIAQREAELAKRARETAKRIAAQR